MRRRHIAIALVALVAACDPASNVEVLPLPALERPSPEARLGLPEVAGSWRFAGWEVIRGDSASLERTFPSFGELRIQTQRLDSIAGVFALGGGPARVVGDVRRNGRLALVTVGPAGADRFIAGEFARDTLWLELTSVLAVDEWPQDARAAFVRGPVAEPIAWLRGAGPVAEPPLPATMPADSGLGGPPTAAPQPGGFQPTSPSPGQVQPQPGPITQPRPAGPAQPQPGGVQPPPAQPRPQPVSPPPAPAPRNPVPEPEPEPRQPEPEPEPEIETREPDLPPLLGDPVQ